MKRFGEAVLYTPGPTSVPPRILNAYSRPVLHHSYAHLFRDPRASFLNKAHMAGLEYTTASPAGTHYRARRDGSGHLQSVVAR